MIGILTLLTPAGIVDLVAVGRVLAGTADPMTTLTDAERRYVAHAMIAAGSGVSAVADTLHMNTATAKRFLAEPYDVEIDPLDHTA